MCLLYTRCVSHIKWGKVFKLLRNYANRNMSSNVRYAFLANTQ